MDIKDFRKVYPFGRARNLDKEEFYREKQDKNLSHALSKKPSLKDYTVILATIVGSIVVMVSVISLNSKNDLRSRAAENVVSFYIFPKSATLNTGQTSLLSPKLNAGNNKISSITATIAFNPAQIRFDKFLLQSTSPNINYQSNSVESANKEGKIKILMVPKVEGEFLTGVVSLPQLQISKLWEGMSGVNFVSMESKVVFTNGATAQIQVDKPTLIYNK